MKKFLIVLALFVNQAISSEILFNEGDQYFGKSDDGTLCALAFEKVERDLQNILGYSENLLHISIEFADTQTIEDYLLRNKAHRHKGVFTPLRTIYFGKKSGNSYFQASSLLLELDEKTMMPKLFTHIFYQDGRLTERSCTF